MGAAAELFGVFTKGDDADDIAVFLGEFHLRAEGFGFFDRQDLGDLGDALGDLEVDFLFDLPLLLFGEGAEGSEVETEVVFVHERAFLIDMFAQDVSDRRMEEVGRRMVPSGELALTFFDDRLHLIAFFDLAIFDLDMDQMLARWGFGDFDDVRAEVLILQ